MSLKFDADSITLATVFGQRRLRREWGHELGARKEEGKVHDKALPVVGNQSAKSAQDYEARNDVYYGSHKIPVNPHRPLASSFFAFGDRSGITQGGTSLIKHHSALERVEHAHQHADADTEPQVQVIYEDKEEKDLPNPPMDAFFQPLSRVSTL